MPLAIEGYPSSKAPTVSENVRALRFRSYEQLARWASQNLNDGQYLAGVVNAPRAVRPFSVEGGAVRVGELVRRLPGRPPTHHGFMLAPPVGRSFGRLANGAFTRTEPPVRLPSKRELRRQKEQDDLAFRLKNDLPLPRRYRRPSLGHR